MKKLLRFGDSFIDPEKILCTHNERIWFTTDTPPLDISQAKYSEFVKALSEHQAQKDKLPRRKRR